MQNIEAYLIAWNEADTIALTIKHYQAFCQKITLYDNYSNDGTDRIAEGLGCHVIKFGRVGELSDKAYLKIKNFCWKKSVADWVIVADCDEILDVQKLDGTIIRTKGFNIYSHDMPKDKFLEIKTGIWDNNYSKLVMFNPKEITDINYSYGCHTANPKGNVVYSSKEATLFHYRCIGGPERIVERHKQYRKRMSDLNKELGLGIHYTYDNERRIREWHEYYDRSEMYLPDGGFS